MGEHAHPSSLGLTCTAALRALVECSDPRDRAERILAACREALGAPGGRVSISGPGGESVLCHEEATGDELVCPILHGPHRLGTLVLSGRAFAPKDRAAAEPFVLLLAVALDGVPRPAEAPDAGLREREAHFRALVEHSPDVVVRFDRTLRLSYVSPSLERRYGGRVADFLGRTLPESPAAAMPELVARWEVAIREAFATGRSSGFEFAVPAPANLVFDAQLVAERDGAGEVHTALAICRDVTAQRQTEQDYRTLFSEMLDGFALHELVYDEAGAPVDYRFLSANPAFCRLTGLADPVGRTCRELLPDLEPLWLDTYARVALGGRPERFEGYVASLARHFEVSAYSPRRGQFVVFFQDVTARKVSEQALQESEARYRALFETSHTAMLLLEPSTGSLLDANAAACSFYGYPREQMLSLRATDLDVSRTPQVILSGLARAVAGPQRFELRSRVASGELRDLDVHCGPLSIHGLPMLYAILHDVTEARQAGALAGRLHAAIEQTSEFVAITDAHKVIEYVNPAFELLTGYGRAEATGRPLSFLHASLGPDGVSREQAYALLGATGRWMGALRLVRKDRAMVEVEASLAALRDEAGHVTGFVAVHRDVTEQRKLEKQLRQAQKMEALGTLAGGIAHDFNNILAAIMGFSTLAQNSLDEGHPARQDLGEVLTASQRARDLVRQILAFSRRTEMHRSPLQVSVLAKEALKLLRATLPSTIEIRSDFSAKDDYVLGDPTQIHQIVMNLCTNAAHAMRERGGVLSVCSEVVEVEAAQAAAVGLRAGPHVRLRVQDTGHGMDSSMIDRAFEPYFTTKGLGEGTGLGLPVVHGIAMQAGGAVAVMSEPGRGTVVDVYLPRHCEEPDRVVLVPNAAPRGAGRILFVDDEPALVRFGKQCLEGLGYQVVAVTSPTDALDLFEDDPEGFDLVISDQTMPQLTGVALAREVHELRPQTPILLCTGYSESIPPDGARSAGVRQVLLKPLPPNELALAVAQALKPSEVN